MDLKERTDNENRHPWELSRTHNIVKTFKRIMPNKDTLIIGDIGAGDGYFDTQLIASLKAENINPVIYAIDNNYENTISNQEEIVLLKDISMLENNSMDCIIMMDVLEHIQEDGTFLEFVVNRLKDGGILLVTVPAFETLFSPHDTYLKHFRRYNYRGLKNLLLSNNLQVIKCHYFYFLLFIVRWLQVTFNKNKSVEENVGIGMWKYSGESFITRSIKFVLNVDFGINAILNKLGVHLPGLSLLAVAIKERDTTEKAE